MRTKEYQLSIELGYGSGVILDFYRSEKQNSPFKYHLYVYWGDNLIFNCTEPLMRDENNYSEQSMLYGCILKALSKQIPETLIEHIDNLPDI